MQSGRAVVSGTGVAGAGTTSGGNPPSRGPAEATIRAIGGRRILGVTAYLIATVQYFVVQAVVASAWRAPAYDWNADYISDLGNTACGPFTLMGRTTEVCSPLHPLMNASFSATGVLLALGTVALMRPWPSARSERAGAVLLLVASAQKVVVGLVPEDTVQVLHAVGALNLLVSAVAVLLLGVGLRRTAPHRAVLWAAIACVSLLALVLFPLSQLRGLDLVPALGIGGIERLAAYPVNAWPLLAGLAALLARPRSDPAAAS